jgi:hypothetical protein
MFYTGIFPKTEEHMRSRILYSGKVKVSKINRNEQ